MMTVIDKQSIEDLRKVGFYAEEAANSMRALRNEAENQMARSKTIRRHMHTGIGDVISVPPPPKRSDHYETAADGSRFKIKDLPECAYCGTLRTNPTIKCDPCGAFMLVKQHTPDISYGKRYVMEPNVEIPLALI